MLSFIRRQAPTDFDDQAGVAASEVIARQPAFIGV